jgi:hypothetical protein
MLFVSVLFRRPGWYTQYYSGTQAVTSQTCSSTNGFTATNHIALKIGSYAYDTAQGHFAGQVAAFQFWNRALLPAEIAALGAVPPTNVGTGGLTIVGVPPLANFSTVWTLKLTSNLSLSNAVQLDLSCSDGVLTVTTFTWGGLTSGVKTTTLTLNQPTGGATSWTCISTLSGAAATYFKTPDPIVIPMWTSDLMWTTALAFSLNTSSPSVHANWIAGAAPGTGIVGVDSNLYLDLMNPADTHTTPFPSYWGGPYTGNTLTFWWQPLSTYNFYSIIMSCNQWSTSRQGEIYFGDDASGGGLDIGQYKQSTTSWWYNTAQPAATAWTFNVVRKSKKDT